MSDELFHYGMPKRSGRYPYGSGENPYQHAGDWRSIDAQRRKDGLTEKQRADAEGLTIREYRAKVAVMKKEDWLRRSYTATTLREKGMSLPAIAERLGEPVSTVVSYLDPKRKERMVSIQNTADVLKKAVAEKGFIDTSAGMEYQLGISKDKLEKTVKL